MITSEETIHLRDLAKRVKDISGDAVWHEKRRLWTDLNSLRKVRPLVLCAIPEEAWREIIPREELLISDGLLSEVEWELKKRVYRARHIGDDEVITDILYVPIRYGLTDWVEGRVRPYSGRADRAAAFTPSLVEYGDLKRMRFPELSLDPGGTRADYEMVADIFGNILDVRLGQPFYAATDIDVLGWGNSLIDILCELRGLGRLFEDLVLAPEFVKEAMDFLMRGTMRCLDAMERENLLRLNNNEFIHKSNTPLGSNGLGITDVLPGEGFDPDAVTCSDLWGYFMAQEFSEVSPEMFAEFVLPYQIPVAERFGLTCYGCCEGNDRKWDLIVESFPHLRELSVSHAADLTVAAERLRGDYVLSWKPNATQMIATFDEEHIRRSMEEAFVVARGCNLVVSLRDTQTLFGNPGRVAAWTRIALDASVSAAS
jgi:hypothetical protein